MGYVPPPSIPPANAEKLRRQWEAMTPAKREAWRRRSESRRDERPAAPESWSGFFWGVLVGSLFD